MMMKPNAIPRPALAAAVLVLLLAALVGPVSAAETADFTQTFEENAGFVINRTPIDETSVDARSTNYVILLISDISAGDYYEFKATAKWDYIRGSDVPTKKYPIKGDITGTAWVAISPETETITVIVASLDSAGKTGKTMCYVDLSPYAYTACISATSSSLLTRTSYSGAVFPASGATIYTLFGSNGPGVAADTGFYRPSRGAATPVTSTTMGVRWKNTIYAAKVPDTEYEYSVGINKSGYKSVAKIYSSQSVAYDSVLATQPTATSDDISDIRTIFGPYKYEVTSPATGKKYTGYYNVSGIYVSVASEPTPGEGGTFSLSLSPTTAPIGEPVQATLTAAAGAPAFTHVVWEWAYEPETQVEYDYRNGGWYRWNSSAGTYADPVTLSDVCTYTFTSNTVGSDYVSVSLFDADFKPIWTGQERATFGTNAYLCDLQLNVREAGSGALVSGARAKITNAKTSQVFMDYPQKIYPGIPFSLYRSQTYYVEVTAAGYLPENKTVYVPNTDKYTADFSLMTGPPPPPDNTFVRVHVVSPPQPDGYRRPVSNAAVMLNGQIKLTDNIGTVVFPVPVNATYTYVVTAAGYEKITGSVDVDLKMVDVNVILVATAPPTPDPGVTSGPGTTPGGITDHRQAMRESMNGIYGFMPGAVSMAFMLLAFAMLKRGLK
jgi:hypothetical protein